MVYERQFAIALGPFVVVSIHVAFGSVANVLGVREKPELGVLIGPVHDMMPQTQLPIVHEL
jgi:hypothetical protein